MQPVIDRYRSECVRINPPTMLPIFALSGATNAYANGFFDRARDSDKQIVGAKDRPMRSCCSLWRLYPSQTAIAIKNAKDKLASVLRGQVFRPSEAIGFAWDDTVLSKVCCKLSRLQFHANAGTSFNFPFSFTWASMPNGLSWRKCIPNQMHQFRVLFMDMKLQDAVTADRSIRSEQSEDICLDRRINYLEVGMTNGSSSTSPPSPCAQSKFSAFVFNCASTSIESCAHFSTAHRRSMLTQVIKFFRLPEPPLWILKWWCRMSHSMSLLFTTFRAKLGGAVAGIEDNATNHAGILEQPAVFSCVGESKRFGFTSDFVRRPIQRLGNVGCRRSGEVLMKICDLFGGPMSKFSITHVTIIPTDDRMFQHIRRTAA